jgi:hypothetical protein
VVTVAVPVAAQGSEYAGARGEGCTNADEDAFIWYPAEQRT